MKMTTSPTSLYSSCMLLLASQPLRAGQNSSPSANLALTPPMGWNSWNKFACNVSEDMIKGMADAVVKSGMKDAGYVYVNIDDCWQVSRDANAQHRRRPAALSARHEGGRRLHPFTRTEVRRLFRRRIEDLCAGRPGGLGHEYQDAMQYAAWGVDYLKYDWCNTTTQDAKASYANMRAALDASGRPIVLSICEWGTAKPWLWGKEVGGNLWRSTGDIQDRWGGQEKWPDGSCCSNGVLAIHRPAGRPAIVRRAGALERSRHARSRQRRHDRRGVSLALQLVGAPGRAADRGQRSAQHASGDSRHPHQQRSDRRRIRIRSGARASAWQRTATWKSGRSNSRMAAAP